MAKQIGDVRTVAESVSPNIFDSILEWGLLLFVIAIVIFVIIIAIKWLMAKKFTAKDIFQEDYKQTINLCKLQRNPRYLQSIMGMPLWLMSKGVPVVIRQPPIDYSKEKKPVDSLGNVLEVLDYRQGGIIKLGNYAGSSVSTDGTMNILVKSTHQKVMFLFPKLFVIKLRHHHVQKIFDSDNPTKMKVIEVPADSFSLSEEMIIIDAINLEKVGQYHYLVNQTKEGYVVDTKPYVYQDLIEISTQKQVIDFGKNLAAVADDWVRGNPLVQFVKKTDTGLTQE